MFINAVIFLLWVTSLKEVGVQIEHTQEVQKGDDLHPPVLKIKANRLFRTYT